MCGISDANEPTDTQNAKCRTTAASGYIYNSLCHVNEILLARNKNALCISGRAKWLMLQAAKELFKCQKRTERSQHQTAALLGFSLEAEEDETSEWTQEATSVTITADSYQTPA